MKNQINPKSYILSKYLLTFAMMFFYLVSFWAILKGIGQNKNDLHYIQENYYLLTGLSLFIGIIFISVYTLIRYNLHKKSGYKFNKKEINKIFISIGLMCLMVVISILVITFPSYTSKTVLMSLAIVTTIIKIIIGFVVSIFETMVRTQEQAIVNKTWFNNDDLKSRNQPKDSGENTSELFKNSSNPFMED
ncbi:hypothetical protein SCHIN_v1c06230 [Spiroplasma chinense]|uniref:Transmembrane protein n=1 Tax=Spiroplasma chinense TaxID=216932 RepID=A0A5B9Y4D6_9MOLU|nr:hypothetical protein [Spiroplasma chinense]QEH61820.1 hypothetical protein SCHIN_v1c06230 [Spiroplasma chinense]